jgi:hypothetical protein
MARIYIASKTKHAPLWRRARAAGAPIISTWIDEAGPGESADLRDLARRCIFEARECSILIVFGQKGDVLKGALMEVGAALAGNVPVFVVGDCEGYKSAVASHPCWFPVATLAQAFLSAGWDKAIDFDFGEAA